MTRCPLLLPPAAAAPCCCPLPPAAAPRCCPPAAAAPCRLLLPPAAAPRCWPLPPAAFRYPLQFLLAASMGLVVNILAVLIIKMSSATTLKAGAGVRRRVHCITLLADAGEARDIVVAVGGCWE